MIKTCGICGDGGIPLNRKGVCKRCYAHAYHAKHADDLAARNKVYRVDHKEEIAAYQKAYRAEHKEEIKAYRVEHNEERAMYYADHKEEIEAYRKAYDADHAEEIAAREKVYRSEHKEERAAWEKVYRRDHPKEERDYITPAGQCVKLNKRFEGCRRHHVDISTIIHIPIEMHVTNPHNIRTGRGMARINALAFAFLGGQRECSAQTTLEAFG